VGITDTRDEHFSHLVYPGKDAADFLHALQAQVHSVFADVIVYRGAPLAGSNILLADIRDGLAWLKSQPKEGDLGVLFLAGHGFNDRDGTYYYIPSNANLDDANGTALSGQEILGALTEMKGYPLLFIDTCHAGNVAGHLLSIDLGGTINRLENQPKGIIVYAAATGEEDSLESDRWENGAFTHVIVEGLSRDAEYEKDHHMVTVSTLHTYLVSHVFDLTGGGQTPTVGLPLNVPDLILANTSK
jgi:uncharacterized caspase-like protein